MVQRSVGRWISTSSVGAFNTATTAPGSDTATQNQTTIISGISNDGKILAHGRIWEFCSNLLVDPATLQRKRKTFFRWPSTLELGEKTFVKYFFLMYPWSTLQTTLQHTNAKLVERKQRPIAEGELFYGNKRSCLHGETRCGKSCSRKV